MDVELVEVNYMQLLDMLKEGKIDAAVWNKDELRYADRFGRGPFRSERARELSEKVSEAVLVVDQEKGKIVEQRLADLSVDRIRAVQEDVEKGRRFASY